jgi:hypothetical protein
MQILCILGYLIFSSQPRTISGFVHDVCLKPTSLELRWIRPQDETQGVNNTIMDNTPPLPPPQGPGSGGERYQPMSSGGKT